MRSDPTRPLPRPPPAPVVRAVLWLHRSLQRLAWRLVPPEMRTFDLAVSAAKTHLLVTGIRVGLFDRLAERPDQTAAEIAAALGLDDGATSRLLRALVALGLVREGRAGRFRNSAAGATCARPGARAGPTGPGSMRAFAEYFASDANLAAWRGAEHAVRTGTPAFQQVHGRSVWDHFDDHPEELACFADAMAALTQAQAAAVATAYPFSGLDGLCDVGGGRGTLAAELLVRDRALRVTVLDRAGVLPHAARHLAERGVSDRAELVAGDFFVDVPAGRRGYLLKQVLHDWDDDRAVAILRRVRAAAQPRARVLVVELRQDQREVGLTAMADVQMMMVSDGGRERSEAEYAGLLGAAGFRYRRAWPTGALLWVFEAEA